MLASGFSNAPLSRTLLTAVVVLSIIASITDTKYYFWIAIKPHLNEYRQFWRLLTWQLCYTNSTEVLFAAMTLYQLRVIERLWGTRKFGSFLISTLPYTTLVPPLLVALILRPLTFGRLNYLPAGPTAVIFALLAQYHAAIPYLYKYQVSATEPAGPSLMLTSKSTSYLLPAQLALSQFPGSAIAALVGWIVGLAYRRELLPGGAARWRIPDVAGKRAERDRYEGLRRRMEGDAATASGTDVGNTGNGRRRGVARAILDQFRGAF
ncbi:hypothetical protein K461DRAFT_276896 [Myriangium duriaei CBS 260.36]|uniref:Peptidase S54 rhomboid domain-containing protein n=1 Tax=Myriangium duriaei CBS 260.36 TaxID=1168546 RepID=A0A9P4J1P1_9PEZI|nr:hypothetical protein K461DRAFT_276896 [Myriangium duriaei CBS 260.36]